MLRLMEKILRNQRSLKNLVLIDEKNRTVLCWSETKTEDLHLAISAENLLQFIRPQQDEIFVTNDFSAGCLYSGQISYLFQVCESAKGKIYGLLREEFLPLNPLPPVPLYQKNYLSDDLFAAIFSQNSDKKFWRSHLESTFKSISELSKRISSFFQEQNFFEHRETFFSQQKDSLRKILSERPFGSQSTFIKSESQNLGKITVTLEESKAHFDFSAQPAEKGPCLPSSLSSSLAFSCFSQAYQLRGPFHHSHFSVIQTVKSPRSFFSSPHRAWDSLPSVQKLEDIEVKIIECIENIHRKKVLRRNFHLPSRLFIRSADDLFEIASSLSTSWGTLLQIKKNDQFVGFPEWIQCLKKAGSHLDKRGLIIQNSGPWVVLHHSGPAPLTETDPQMRTWNFMNSL